VCHTPKFFPPLCFNGGYEEHFTIVAGTSRPGSAWPGVPGLPSIIDLAEGYWFLELQWNLEVGIWSFALRAPPSSRTPAARTQTPPANLRKPAQTNARSSPSDFFPAQPFHSRRVEIGPGT